MLSAAHLSALRPVYPAEKIDEPTKLFYIAYLKQTVDLGPQGQAC